MRRFLLCISIVLLLLIISKNGSAQVWIRSVEIPCVVTDKAGRFVSDLSENDFIVRDNGKKQKITGVKFRLQEPLSVALVLDRSRSVAPSFELMKATSEEFLKTMIRKSTDRACLRSTTTLRPSSSPIRKTAAVESDNAEEKDSLDGPMLTMDDLRRFDKARALKESGLPLPGKPQRALVILGEVLDYEKGNHILQYFPFNIGSTIFTIRFRYFDKQTGEELGRQIITGEVSSDTYAGFVGMHSALKDVVEGLADQVTRRVLQSEQ